MVRTDIVKTTIEQKSVTIESTMITLETKMRRNIRLFGVYKVFTKRVFLPLITIYATQQAGLNINQIGIATAAGSLFSFILDTPTGFWADIHGRRRSAQVGALLEALGSFLYVISTGFEGIFVASLAMAAGYSFLIVLKQWGQAVTIFLTS